MKKILFSFLRFLCVIILAGLSLNLFAQSSGFNYQALINSSITSEVTIEWTVDTYTGTVAAVPSDGVISAVICEGVNFSQITNPVLEITLYANGTVIGTSTQTLYSVPYADVAGNVYVNADGDLVVNNQIINFNLPESPEFTNISVTNHGVFGGNGPAIINDFGQEQWGIESATAAISTRGGIYAEGESFFNNVFGVKSFRIYNTDYTSANIILGIDDEYPLNVGQNSEQYIPSYMALNQLYNDLYNESCENTVNMIDSLSALCLHTDPWQGIIENAVIDIAWLQNGINLQNAYDMGREINTDAPIYIHGPFGLMSQAEGADDVDLYAIMGSIDDNIYGALGTRIYGHNWAGYFIGDVNINGEFYAGGESHLGDVEIYDLRVLHNAIFSSLTSNAAAIHNLNAVTGIVGTLEASTADFNSAYMNMITIGQYYGSPLAMQGTAEGGFDFYKPVRFHNTVSFNGMTDDLIFGNAIGDSLSADYIFGDNIVSNLFEGDIVSDNIITDNFISNNLKTTTGEFDDLSVRHMELSDTIKDASEFTKKVMKVQLRDEVTDIYTVQSLLGASTDEFNTYGVDHITSAVVGHNNLDGVGSLGSVLFDVTNTELIDAFGITAGDNLVLAGFFYGDVAVTGNLAADRVISHTALFQTKAVDEMEYKMVDADYTIELGGDVTGFTGILGGTAPTGYGWTSAHAAVTGYEKLAADPSVRNGIGALGAKIYGITEELVCNPWDVASGDNKVFAGFFVGDVHVQGKLAVSHDAGTATTVWTTNTTFKAATGRIYKAFQGAATPATITTEWEQTEAALATDIPSLEVITGLSAIVYNLSTTGKLYEAFGPTGWNRLQDLNGDGNVNDKTFAGFFQGDVAINGNLAVNGNVKINGTLDTTSSGISIPYYPATLGLNYVTDLNTSYPPSQEGQICVAYLTSTGKNVMYIAYDNGSGLQWNAVAGTSK